MRSFYNAFTKKSAYFTSCSHSFSRLGTGIGMLDETSDMPKYQWKLTIVERNLLLSNWMKLLPEAQEQMLWEANVLMEEDLSLPDKQRLLISLETLQDHTEEDFQQKIQEILSSQLNLDIREALELNIQNTTFCADGLEIDASALVESIN